MKFDVENGATGAIQPSVQPTPPIDSPALPESPAEKED